MSEATLPVEDAPLRVCVCCGMPAASRGMPACWDHWTVLPEDLRSSIVISQGRGQLAVYAENLLDAVQVWRANGVWRRKPDGALPPPAETPDEVLLEPAVPGRVFSLFDRRSHSARWSPNPSVLGKRSA